MQAGPTVSALILVPTLRHAEKRGVKPALLLKRVGLMESDLEAAGTRIPFGQFEALTRYAAEMTGDACLGLHVAEHFSTGALGILGFVLMNCRTLVEAMDKYCRYQRVTGEGIITGMERAPGSLTIRFDFFEGCPAPNRQLMEGMAASALGMLKALSGEPIRPTRVDLASAAPGPDLAGEYDRIFGCPIFFDRAFDALTFSEALLGTRVLQPSRELLALFETHTVEHLRKMDEKLIYAKRVGEECARMLHGDVPNIEAVARKLAMSPRNLQLKLREEGTSYRETLDRVRMDLALGQLKNRQVTVAEVAYLLGFSEPSVFHRSFKRWTGTTPRDFRQSLRA
jgi:AraC-like DNA-binding protein